MSMTYCLHVDPRCENPSASAYGASLIQNGIGFSVHILESGRYLFTFDSDSDYVKAESLLWEE